VNMQDTVIQTV